MTDEAQQSTGGRFPEMGVRIGGTWYVWKERIDKTAIALKRARDTASNAINLIALVIVAVALLMVLYFAFFRDADRIFTASYWLEPSGTGLALSVAAFFGAFLFYRFAEAIRQKAQMPTRGKKTVAPPVEQLQADEEKRAQNIADLFDADGRKAIEEAYKLAVRFKHRNVLPLHVFVGTLVSDDVGVLFGRLGLTFDQVKGPLNRRLMDREVGEPTVFAKETEEVFLQAFLNAYLQKRNVVSALELFFETYKRDEFLQELLYDLNVDKEMLENVVEWIRITGKLRERYEEFQQAAMFKPTGAMNRAMTSVATKELDAVSEDLTAAAVKGYLPLLINREKEVEQVFRIIEGGGQSALLVGPDGVGKSAIISGIAQRMVAENVPKILQDKRLVRISIPHILSGASPAEAQERLMRVMGDVARAGNVVLAISNIDQLVDASGQGADLSGVMADLLSRGFTFVIATTTPQAYAGKIEQSVLSRVFQKVDVKEPDPTTAIHVVESKIGQIEHEHNVIFSYEAIDRAVKLSDRYMHEQYLPEKAIAICKEVALQVAKTKGKEAFVKAEDVSMIVSEKSGVPVEETTAEEKETLLKLEERMHERMVDQDEAVSAVASALRRARAELRETDRPIATFLFLGPTGVGKTELAKTIADAYFGDEEAMIRLDMSEYQEKASISRLIGAPGSKEGGQLTEAVRNNPFSIVLLDEFEKANPDILNLFLQVFDDGRLTDAAGRTIDFTNTILVATSNAGAEYIQDAVKEGTSVEQMKTHLIEEGLRGIYRPELLNRFDGVMVFKPLSMEDVEKIARMMVQDVAKRLEPKGIKLEPTEAALQELAKKGYDPQFGARPLQRVVQEEVNDAIATALLEGKVERRDTIVLKKGGGIEIKKAEEL